ncbi:MAG: Asp-tRNA(Asn)/Glu-tRNA(Gln) amidotransferase subunit GatB [Candidatus Pacebacteria bacterium]|nr:Asp-tRNA(Asn)/Glu-tRNA(Gln) amidotransferase subunit GatB [Candidatus Paceibacterota bacterium]
MKEYKPTIGLEIHIELKTKTKMFCSCLNDSDEKKPNFNVCPVCMGHPGTLPVINEEAVKKVIKTGLALNCQIPESSKFDRKNYFYPDLPKGYQISQYDKPLSVGGFLEIDGKKIRITRVHLEEDTGSLVHPEGQDFSLVDFNRAGIPLMELVTEPDITSAKEAKDFAEALHLILHYLDVSDADMEKGQMRVEVNISLEEKGKMGTKVEIKNLNSFRAVERGIEYEIKRQQEVLESGKEVLQETRGWDDVKGKTFSQREKEEAHDYRYFPEPDLSPLYFSKESVQKIKAEIPELPQQKTVRLKREYELSDKEAEILVYNKDFGEYFEKVISEFPPQLPREKLSRLIKLSSNYLISDLRGLLSGTSIRNEKFLITPDNFADFIVLIEKGTISSKIAKLVLSEMFKNGADPSNIVKEKKLTQISDSSEIEKVIKEVIENNPKAVEDYKSGKGNAFQFLVGQIMAKTKGKANPQMAGESLKKALTNL